MGTPGEGLGTPGEALGTPWEALGTPWGTLGAPPWGNCGDSWEEPPWKTFLEAQQGLGDVGSAKSLKSIPL